MTKLITLKKCVNIADSERLADGVQSSTAMLEKMTPVFSLNFQTKRKGEKMKLALKDENLKFIYRCPDCEQLVDGMTITPPWRIYCRKCRQELQNPDHPEYYPLPNKEQKENDKDN